MNNKECDVDDYMHKNMDLYATLIDKKLVIIQYIYMGI
jgi:hypothetical protein